MASGTQLQAFFATLQARAALDHARQAVEAAQQATRQAVAHGDDCIDTHNEMARAAITLRQLQERAPDA
jgi:nitrate/TMAO reductase-like tetraheme cytochrome c subunit